MRIEAEEPAEIEYAQLPPEDVQSRDAVRERRRADKRCPRGLRGRTARLERAERRGRYARLEQAVRDRYPEFWSGVSC